MSGGDRGDPATVVTLGLLGALLVCCLIVAVLAYSQGRETERRYQSPLQHAESAKAAAQKACANADPDAAFDCVYERVEASEEHAHSEQDLNAQQRAADSALISAVTSVITLLISGIGIWGLLQTIRQGQEGLQRTTEANEIARQQFEAGFKPWLTVTPEDKIILVDESKMRRGSAGPTVVNIVVAITNIVDMPATILRTAFVWRGAGPPKVQENLFYIVGKGESYTLECTGCYSAGGWDREKFMKEEPPVLIGNVLYLDPLGIVRELGFAFVPQSLWVPKLNRWGGAAYNYDRTHKPEGG